MGKRMRKWLLLFVAALTMTGTIGCSNDDDDTTPTPTPNQQYSYRTILVFMPWSGPSNPLTGYFWQNIRDLQTAKKKWGKGEKIIVYINTSGSKAVMFNIDDFTGNDSASLSHYTQMDSIPYTKAEGLAQLIDTMKAAAPATDYSMIVGCHGMGWIPIEDYVNLRKSKAAPFKYHWDYTNADGIVTRFFGGTNSTYGIDITTLAEALETTNTKLDFLLFDDCYMSSLEAVYDLRHVADYVIGCPTEVMGPGMPYSTLGQHLLGVPNYEGVCSAFLAFYNAYSYPYGTIGVTKTDQLDSLAAIAKEINSLYEFDTNLRSSLQRMDGYSPIIFYDYGDYISHLCTDSALLQRFNDQLAKAVPYKAHTTRYYSNNGNSYAINAYSGITTSEPSDNRLAATLTETSWYRATH